MSITCLDRFISLNVPIVAEILQSMRDWLLNWPICCHGLLFADNWPVEMQGMIKLLLGLIRLPIVNVLPLTATFTLSVAAWCVALRAIAEQ